MTDRHPDRRQTEWNDNKAHYRDAIYETSSIEPISMWNTGYWINRSFNYLLAARCGVLIMACIAISAARRLWV